MRLLHRRRPGPRAKTARPGSRAPPGAALSEPSWGSIACRGRDQVLAWLRASSAGSHQVDALELVADHDHVVLGVYDQSREELAGVELHGQLFTVFTVDEGQIVHLRDYAHRADAPRRRGPRRPPVAVTEPSSLALMGGWCHRGSQPMASTIASATRRHVASWSCSPRCVLNASRAIEP
jgi:limonene-1,2-epoxide hydrolase